MPARSRSSPQSRQHQGPDGRDAKSFNMMILTILSISHPHPVQEREFPLSFSSLHSSFFLPTPPPQNRTNPTKYLLCLGAAARCSIPYNRIQRSLSQPTSVEGAAQYPPSVHRSGLLRRSRLEPTSSQPASASFPLPYCRRAMC